MFIIVAALSVETNYINRTGRYATFDDSTFAYYSESNETAEFNSTFNATHMVLNNITNSSLPVLSLALIGNGTNYFNRTNSNATYDDFFQPFAYSLVLNETAEFNSTFNVTGIVFNNITNSSFVPFVYDLDFDAKNISINSSSSSFTYSYSGLETLAPSFAPAIGNMNRSYSLLTWNTYLAFYFDSTIIFDLTCIHTSNCNSSSSSFKDGIVIEKSIVLTYLEAVNNLLSLRDVNYSSISVNQTKSVHVSTRKSQFNEQHANIVNSAQIAMPVSTVTLSNKVYLLNGNKSSAELFYHKVVQASETFPKSDFQSYMRHFLADNGLDYVNFTFLSLQFDSPNISQIIIHSPSSPSVPPPALTFPPSVAKVGRPSKFPTSFIPTKYVTLSPSLAPVAANVVPIPSYVIALIAVAAAGIVGAAIYFFCFKKSSNKRKIHQMMDEAEVEDDKDF